MALVLAPFGNNHEPSIQLARSNLGDSEIADFGDELNMPQPRFSIAVDGNADEADSFNEEFSGSSMLSENGERTNTSVEKGRRIVSENCSDTAARDTFDSIHANHRFRINSDLEFNGALLNSFDDSITQASFMAGVDDTRTSRYQLDIG